MFDSVDPKQSFPKLEEGILSYWAEERVFHRSQERRIGGESFSFYDGPPFATGLPHYGHLLAGTIKDVIPRFQTMRGKYVERRFGWDCHGLPIENIIEKEHNLKQKRDIEAMGIGNFNELCRSTVLRYAKEWRTTVERTGRWVDMDWDYRTMDADYMESIWWVFCQLWDKNLIEEGHKPMHICPRCVTPLANFEVNQGYKDVTDLSATVKFKLKGEKETYVLAWTTTPWTLPGNVFLAIGKGIHYVFVQYEGARYVVAESLVAKVFKDKEHAIEGHATHEWLLEKTYEPLFPYFREEYQEKAFKIVAGDFVTLEDGTGIVHIAPGFGEDDFAVGKREGIPLLQHVTMEGVFIAAVTDFAGMHAKPIDDPSKTDHKVAEWLEKHGKLFAKESYRHSYPHCWRCDSPLLNYATSSWFVKVEKIKETMLTTNKETEWVPEHLRDGRFGKWLEGARDWAISRNRYWGTPLPIWRCAETDDIEVIGSRDDLMHHCPIRFTKLTVLRHGESEGNLIPVYQSKEPGTDLTKRGETQAKAAALWLKDQNVSVIYCSPLARAQQTADAIAKATGATVIVDERLREVDMGSFEGKSIDASDTNLVKAKRAHKMQSGSAEGMHHFAGMETWGESQTRINTFLQSVLPVHRSEHICVVTHGDTMNNVKHFFTNEDPQKITRQPYPEYADPVAYFWDHEREQSLDLHKHIVDDITWWGSTAAGAGTLTLLRHGETEWNAEGKVQGGTDEILLNEKGRSQAEAWAKTMKKGSFDVLVTSDLKRAEETAAIVGEILGIPVTEKLHLFRERDYGSWGGQTVEAILQKHPLPFDSRKMPLHPATPEGGESLSAFIKRLNEGYEYLLKKYPGKRILVATHGGCIRVLKCVKENLSYQEAASFSIDNCDTYEMPLSPRLKRIPEVLDCWFESGSMPYAQSHYPFEPRTLHRNSNDASKPHSDPLKQLPPGFPADFIAEGIDQTRGWFYTLTVLAAALYQKPAFHHCVVNGTVLAEDGRKMSKKLKNYPDPTLVVDKYGADAMRFTLMKSPAVRAEDLRFSERTVEETVRSVILPLWNCYAFFVTYANAAKFDPVASRTRSQHPMDRYVRAETQDLVNRMTKELEAYDLSATCKQLEETIDALTNWYIRLSRRRFAGKGSIDAAEVDGDINEDGQHDALSTLHEVLVTITQLLAPFCPFLAESMYLNLVPEEHGSVHLTDWPTEKALTKEEKSLLQRNRLLRRMVSLGLKVRSEQKIKIRQPLMVATIAVPPSVLGGVALTEDDIQLLRAELNVKEIALTDDPGSLGSAIVQVNARKVGPRLGGRVQDVITAGKRGEFEVQTDGSILILEERLTADEATIVYQGKEGQNLAADGGIVLGMNTNVNDALRQEGDARDVIRAVQKLRKEAGLSISDRITLSIENADALLEVFGDLITQETGSVFGKSAGEPHVITLDDSSSLTIRFHV